MATIYVDENKNIHALDSIIDSLPVGSIVLWPSNTAPAGWFICNGDAISRTKYEDLFSVVGISYGPGDNSTTFNLPDFRGRTPVGVNDGTGSVSETFSLASSGGEVTHTLTINEMPSHSHGISANAHISSQAHSSGEARWPWTDWQEANRATWNAGGGQAHNNMQPYLVVNYIIKAFYSVKAISNRAEVINNLSSSSITDALSAAMGAQLYGETLFTGDTTSSSISINKSISLFHRIKIYGYVVHNSEPNNKSLNFGQEFLVSGNNDRYCISGLSYAGSTYMYMFGCVLTISGTSVTRGTNVKIYSTQLDTDDNIVLHITEIRGFYS